MKSLQEGVIRNSIQSGIITPLAQHWGLDCRACGLRDWGSEGSFLLGSFARGKRTKIGLGPAGKGEGKILGKVLTRKEGTTSKFSPVSDP